MQNLEDARKELAKVTSEKHLKARLDRLRNLPEEIATPGFGLLDRDISGRELSYQERMKPLQNQVREAIARDVTIREPILKALFPSFAAEIERGIEVFPRLPFTIGYLRRPFRAPNRHGLYYSAFGSYLYWVVNSLTDIDDTVLTPEWVASWAVHLTYGGGMGPLFSSQIDSGNDQVFEILKDSAAGRHEIGGPGLHSIRGLLCCNRPEAWDFVADLLLAAQRQEGLRQTILESVDESNPQAFAKLLEVVLDENLIRFASVARAVSVWLGEELMVDDAKTLKTALSALREATNDPRARDKAIESNDAAAVYRGLWSLAFEDMDKAVEAARPIFRSKDSARKIAAIKLLADSDTSIGEDAARPLLEDSDPAVLSAVLSYYSQLVSKSRQECEIQYPANLFEALEKLLPELPAKPETVPSPVSSWRLPDLHAEPVADMMVECLQDRPAERLLPWLKLMRPTQRAAALKKLCAIDTISSRVCQVLLAAATETNVVVRDEALKQLKKCDLGQDEVRMIEGLLTRKPPDYRLAIFELLLGQTDEHAVRSIERLLSGDPMQRSGGIEIARQMVEKDRMAEAVRHVLKAFVTKKGDKLKEAERVAIERISNPVEAEPPTLENGLGLFDPKDRSPVVQPQKQNVKISSLAAVAFLKSLDDLIHEHRQKPLKSRYRDEILLGSIRWSIFFGKPVFDESRDENLAAFPLRDIWIEWYRVRPAETRDEDGLELIRAKAQYLKESREGEVDGPDEAVDDDLPTDLDDTTQNAIWELHPMPVVQVRYKVVIEALLDWFVYLFEPPETLEFLLDAAEHSFAFVTDTMLESLPDKGEPSCDKHDQDWRHVASRDGHEARIFVSYFMELNKLASMPGRELDKATIERIFRLHRWLEEPRPGANRVRVSLKWIVPAYQHGVATLADFYDCLIGPRMIVSRNSGMGFDAIRNLSYPDRPKWLSECPSIDDIPDLREAFRKTLDRLFEVELARGETQTVSTRAANVIQSYSPITPIFRLMEAIGKAGFKKSYYYSSDTKAEALTHLVQILVPGEGDTPEAFAQAAKPWIDSGKIPPEQFVTLGLVNTKLMHHAAAVVNWPGYEEACYWFMAHADGNHSNTLTMHAHAEESADKKAWRSVVKERSNLTAEQRADGVIDVDWFHAAYRALNDDARWDEIEKSARFLGFGYAEKKAARLADVLLGRTTRKELIDSIQKKFLKESVKLLGLLPLPTKAGERTAEIAARYKVLKEYERYARGLSSLSKEPAMQAFRLGMENLAVTAGYADPVRLEWAVSAQETEDLARGPVSVKAKDVTVTLTLGDFAEPVTSQSQSGKELKSLPKEAKADAAVAELLERKKDLKRLVASTKRTLELAMCAGERFTPAELKSLMGHPLVKPFLDRLVLKTEAGLGYPVKNGGSLQSVDGNAIPVKGFWSIAHPLDFVASGNWHEFQADCFEKERIQPFKQVFREVYTLTQAEKEDGDRSRRYSGQQVNENQAKSLLAVRGWSTREELTKLYRREDLFVDLQLDHGYTTPADATSPVVGQVIFHKRGSWKPLPLDKVPPIIFSEVMRDLDLVVSVAHVGGVDPEATQSTVEMRACLLEETCELLKLDNVKIDSKHVLIQGQYSRYSVHLGSGVVHKQPGGALCVVAVPAQHRGRLFLPFADDDPRTGEVIAKVLMLARDKEIKDPTILEQIVAR